MAEWGGAIRLLLALALPWLVGAQLVQLLLMVLPLPKATSHSARWGIILAYGFLIGTLMPPVLLSAQHAMGYGLDFGVPALCLALLSLVLFVRSRRQATCKPVPAVGLGGTGAPAPLGAVSALATVILLVVAVRLAMAGADILSGPLLPWDAWWHYATKAKLWVEAGTLVPAVTPGQWLHSNDAGVFALSTDKYDTLPLLQAWTALAWGGWDDAVAGIPWLYCAVALATGVFALLRVCGLNSAVAAGGAYAVVSMPLVYTHIALAGYPDLWVAFAVVLAAGALFNWYATPQAPIFLALFVIASIAAAVYKKPGLLWVVVVALPLALRLLPRKVVWGLGGLVSLLLFATLLLPSGLYIELGGATVLQLRLPGTSILPWVGEISLEYRDVGSAIVENLFVLDNWHLLWFWLPLAVVVGLARIARPAERSALATVLLALAVLTFIYGFTQRAEWAQDFTQINRAILHIAPMLTFFIFWMSRDWRALSTSSMVREPR